MKKIIIAAATGLSIALSAQAGEYEQVQECVEIANIAGELNEAKNQGVSFEQIITATSRAVTEKEIRELYYHLLVLVYYSDLQNTNTSEVMKGIFLQCIVDGVNS